MQARRGRAATAQPSRRYSTRTPAGPSFQAVHPTAADPAPCHAAAPGSQAQAGRGRGQASRGGQEQRRLLAGRAPPCSTRQHSPGAARARQHPPREAACPHTAPGTRARWQQSCKARQGRPAPSARGQHSRCSQGWSMVAATVHGIAAASCGGCTRCLSELLKGSGRLGAQPATEMHRRL